MKHILKGYLAMNNRKPGKIAASMTLEASIALPLFVFFFLNIMSAIIMIQIQSELEAELHQTGNEIALRAYDIYEGEQLLGEDNENGFGLLEKGGMAVFAVSKIRSDLKEKLSHNPVMDGIDSLDFISSKVMQDGDIIDIVVRYKIHPVVSLIGFSGFDAESRYYGHAWTGYDVSGSGDTEGIQEEMVYVTEHGEVYHKDIDCKYLKTSVKSISFAGLNKERNADRKKYYPCEYCGETIHGGNVFVTKYGEKYHGSIDCPGLKRKIYTISILEVGGRSPCSACGN